jgi:hypothetical protein
LHFFNTEDEVGALAEAARLLAESGGAAWYIVTAKRLVKPT